MNKAQAITVGKALAKSLEDLEAKYPGCEVVAELHDKLGHLRQRAVEHYGEPDVTTWGGTDKPPPG